MLRSAVLLVSGCVFTMSAQAAGSAIVGANRQIGFESISTRVDYTETGNGRLGTATGVLDTESGPVPGISFHLSVMGDWLAGNDYLRVEYDHSNGFTHYVGAYQGGTYGSVVQNSSAVFNNVAFRYGKGFEQGGNAMLTPFLEFGMHQWDRGVNYGETYTHTYQGLGFLQQYELSERAVLEINAMYGYTGNSYIVVNSGPLLTGFSGSLGDSEIYRAGLGLDYQLGQKLHLTLGVDYMAFSYGISATYPSGTGSVWEPDSTTAYTITRVGLGSEF